MRMRRKTLAGLALGTCLLLGLGLAGLRVGSQPVGAGSGYTALSDDQMSHLVGGDSCTGCRYDGRRIDECFHSSLMDACRKDMCIANYAVESTCDPGVGTCTAFQTMSQPWVVQYLRADSNCYTTNPTGWTAWYNHYYGSICTKVTPNVRCQKSLGSCDGALIDSSCRYPGIQCQ